MGDGRRQPEGRRPADRVKAIDAAKLPPELARWRGRRMLLYDAKGTVCEATIKSFRMLSRVIPHFGTRQEWKQLKPDVVTAQAWELGAKILVGELDTPCGDAMWAQPATLGPVAVDGGAEADDATRARVVAHVRRSTEWQAMQTAYREPARERRASGGTSCRTGRRACFASAARSRGAT